MMHELKIESEYLRAILDGSKRCEIRKNDRGFKVGDELTLRAGKHWVRVGISRIDTFAQVDNYVVLSIVRFAAGMDR